MRLPARIGLITLACRGVERVAGLFRELGQAVHETLRGIDGVELLGEAEEAFWGGGFAGRDPEGNVWNVGWAKGTRLDQRGGVTFP
jgi:hypothetical protein